MLHIPNDFLEIAWQRLVDEYVPTNEDQMIFLVTGKLIFTKFWNILMFLSTEYRDISGVHLRVLGVGQFLHFTRPYWLVVQIQNATRNEPAPRQS